MQAAAFAIFALQQPLPLEEISEAAETGRLPLAASQTPNWFSAAASEESSLLETAPELLVLPADLDSADAVDVTGIDLIHVYAPELEAIAGIEDDPEEELPERDAPAVETPRTSTQFGLLKELSNLDS
jgi:hypothetical protein